jgi:hypothetical protein
MIEYNLKDDRVKIVLNGASRTVHKLGPYIMGGLSRLGFPDHLLGHWRRIYYPHVGSDGTPLYSSGNRGERDVLKAIDRLNSSQSYFSVDLGEGEIVISRTKTQG